MSSIQLITIKKNLQGQIDGKQLLPIALYGAAGIGKSSLVKQAAADLGVGYIDYAISSTTLENWSGLPDFIEVKDYTKYSKIGAKQNRGTTWTIPSVIYQANKIAEENNGCILALEDLHTMSKSGVEEIMYELLLTKSIGDYKLHPKVAIIATLNHSKESGGGSFNSAAVKSRLRLSEYIFSFETWFNEYGRYLNPYISSFIKTHQQYISEVETKTLTPSGSARSYTLLSNEYNLYSDSELQSVYLELAAGVMTPAAVNALEKHITIINKMDFASIVKNRTIPTISTMPELDKGLWSHIIHHIKTVDDGAYLIDLLNQVYTQDDPETLVGFIAYTLSTQFNIKMSGDEVTPGISIVLDKIIQDYNPKNYKLTKKQTESLSSINIQNRTELLTIFNKYINN